MAWFEKYEQPGTSGRIAEHGDPAEVHEWALENAVAIANASRRWLANPFIRNTVDAQRNPQL